MVRILVLCLLLFTDACSNTVTALDVLWLLNTDLVCYAFCLAF
jgi:hypothetical protein